MEHETQKYQHCLWEKPCLKTLLKTTGIHQVRWWVKVTFVHNLLPSDDMWDAHNPILTWITTLPDRKHHITLLLHRADMSSYLSKNINRPLYSSSKPLLRNSVWEHLPLFMVFNAMVPFIFDDNFIVKQKSPTLHHRQSYIAIKKEAFLKTILSPCT